MARSPRLLSLAGLAAVSGLVIALAGGCAPAGTPASPGAPVAGGDTPATIGPATTAPVPPTPNVTDASGCGTYLALTEADSGRTVCVHPGGAVTVTLHGAPGVLWRPVSLTGDALTEAKAPAPTAVVVGVTTAAYRADHPGTATLQSSRSLCPPAKPGSAACQAMQAFILTVQVR